MSKARQLSVMPDTTFGMRNRILNGQMQIDQRNAGASVTITSADISQYTLDRFYIRTSSATGSKISTQRSTVAPNGFSNSMLITSLSSYSIGASEHFGTTQPIEGFNTADLGWGTATAQSVTLSFWVRSSLTGTFGGHLANSDVSRCFVYSYTINAANTWEYKTITIPGDITGTWLTENNIGIFVNFNIAAGSSVTGTAGSWSGTFKRSVTGQTSVVGTNGATFYITGVQLEKGSTATSFDYRPYGTELALCQRYFEKSYNIETAVGTSSSDGRLITYGTSDGSNLAGYMINFKISKRTTPTMTYYTETGTSGQWSYGRSGASGFATANAYAVNQQAAQVYLNVGAGWAANFVYGHFTASAEL